MSKIDNLNYIKEFGIDNFLEKEINQWQCEKCKSYIFAHNGL